MKILVLCTGNSARSQMAEGLIRYLAGGRLVVESAGTQPSTVRPEAIAALSELGIDISSHRSKSIDEFKEVEFDHVLTVCDSAKEECPWFPTAAVTTHHSFEDPAACDGSEEEKLTLFRRVRDEIKEYLEEEYFPAIGLN
jgi:arsenate reductase (thioredoxin)